MRYAGFYLRTTRPVSSPAPEAMLACHDWWWQLMHCQTQPGKTAQHISFHRNNKLHLRRAPGGSGHCHNDAARANEKWNAPSSVFLLFCLGRCCTHDWLLGEWFAAQTISSDTETPCISHLYYTATHCLRGVFFSSWSRKDEDRQCLLSWKCIPLGNPQHETNKHPPHDTLAIHSHLHGYVGCCQDSVSVQC